MDSKLKYDNRILYFDLLRVLAVYGVMILHTASTSWYTADVKSYEWQVLNAADSLVRWCVPAFVMISGALFLGRSISLEKILKKHVLRIITAFVFWSVIYAMIERSRGMGLRDLVFALLGGHYHMWFLFMITGLYLIVPLLKKIVESEESLKYFLLLAFIFSFAIPQGIDLIKLRSTDIYDRINAIFGRMHYHLTVGYAGYFILGYYLHKTIIGKKFRMMIYLLGLTGFASTIIGTDAISMYLSKPYSGLYNEFTVNVLLESIAVFVFFKYNTDRIRTGNRIRSCIVKLSDLSFGAYLVHILILEQMTQRFGFNTGMYDPILSLLTISLILFVSSFAVSYIFKHIPYLKKYVV